MPNFSRLVKGSAAELPRLDLLKASSDRLLGVGGEMAKTLREDLKIHTIFDLATSSIFNAALSLVTPQSELAREALKEGLVPGDILDQSDGAEVKPATIGGEGIEKLRFNDPKAAAKIKEELGVETIRDFALWTPFQTARALLLDTFETDGDGAQPAAAPNNGTPTDLLPKSGNMASQKAYYQSTYIIDADLVHEGNEGHETFDLGKEGQIDLLHTALTQEGFNEAALGIRVLSEQSWYVEGVTLGPMIHSVALAPGEVTRLAVTNWAQRTLGQRGESLSQTDDLSWDTDHQMAISSITNSVAHETQYGSNRTETTSDASQTGNSGGFAFGILGSVGGSGSSSRNNSVTTSVSRSEGTRNLSSQNNRDINGRTHQQANAARERRSAVIQETRESETETLTTRVVANYNHMHPMTMQYYEVVQDYRVATRAIDYERRVFVPLKLFSFKDPRVILRYRPILEALTTDETVKKQLAAANESHWRDGHIVTLVDPQGNHLHDVSLTDPQLAKIDYELRGSGFIDGIQLMFNDGTMLSSGPGGIPGDSRGEARGSVFVDQNIPISQLAKVLYDPDYAYAGNTLTLTYHFRKGNETGSYTQVITLTGDYCGYEAVHFQVSKTDESGAIAHLEENALYYSQGIWLTMDPTDWMKALLTVTYKGKPVAPTIEPTPVALLGNCVAFPWHFANENEKLDWLLETGLLDRDFNAWLAKKGYGTVTDDVKEEYLDLVGEPHGDAGLKETLVPIPTGGVFAEAVLGRANCAEKTDLTRFWNWQDSPIQIMPPEIDKLTAGGHKSAAEILSDLAAAGFDPEAIHIHPASPQGEINAAAASAQSSTDALMKALTAANMFRDMSNAATTTAIGAQSIQTAEAGAKAAGEQATENMKIASDSAIQGLQMIGDLAKQVLPLLLAPETGGASLLMGGEASTAGAALNAAGDLDKVAEGAEGAEGAVGEAEGAGSTAEGLAGATEGLSSIAGVLGGLL